MTVASWIVTGVLAWVLFVALFLSIARVCGRPTPKPPERMDALTHGSAGRAAHAQACAGPPPARRTRLTVVDERRPGTTDPGAP